MTGSARGAFSEAREAGDGESPRDRVDVWWIDLDAVEGETLELSAEERQAAMRRHSEALRRRYAAAHAALREILGSYAGIAPRDIELERAENGKPFLSRPSAPRFNMSHSAHVAVCAIDEVADIGVDCELVAPFARLPTLARWIMTDEEHARFELLEGERRIQRFYDTWVRKEAVSKATGDGLSLAFRSLSVAPERARVPVSLGSRILHVRSLEAPTGFAAAVATSRPVGAFETFRFAARRRGRRR